MRLESMNKVYKSVEHIFDLPWTLGAALNGNLIAFPGEIDSKFYFSYALDLSHSNNPSPKVSISVDNKKYIAGVLGMIGRLEESMKYNNALKTSFLNYQKNPNTSVTSLLNNNLLNTGNFKFIQSLSASFQVMKTSANRVNIHLLDEGALIDWRYYESMDFGLFHTILTGSLEDFVNEDTIVALMKSQVRKDKYSN